LETGTLSNQIVRSFYLDRFCPHTCWLEARAVERHCSALTFYADSPACTVVPFTVTQLAY